VKKKQTKKKRKLVRSRNWAEEHQHDYAFTHDRARHRRAQPAVSEAAARDLNPLPRDFTPNAVVVNHAKRWAVVTMDREEKLCIIDERLQEGETTLLAPGDEVLVESEADETIVRGVAPRRTRLSRPAGEHARTKEQVFAANVDILVVVAAAADPPFKAGLVDRFLIAAEIGGVTPLLCLNKVDLVDEEPEEIALYRELGLKTLRTSCATGEGIDALRDALRGKVAVLSGHSGVGKSSLLNALDPDLDLDTQSVSERSNRGRHTTTAARLFPLEGGIRIIDTPGIRSLGLWEVSASEVAYFFPEIAAVSPECRYRNCTHTHEPQCAVHAAAARGDIPQARYASYLRIHASLESSTGTTPGRLIMKYVGNKKPLGG